MGGLPKDRWVHIGVSFSRPDIRTYLNGKLAGSAKWDYSVGTDGDILLGRWMGNTTHRGLIDDLRIYKRALSAEEMAELADWTSHAQSDYEIVEDHPAVPEIARWETSNAIFVVGEDGQLHSCRLKATADSAERELLSAPAPLGCLALEGGRMLFGRRASVDDAGRLLINFNRQGGQVRLVPRIEADYVVLTVDEVTVPDVRSVYFCRLSTVMDRYVGAMAGLISDDEAGLCLRSLSLGVDTRFAQRPPQLQAWTTAEHGLCGHSVALLAAPRARLRPLLQCLAEREAVPRSAHGGPFAADSPATRGSYLFADLAAAQTDDWIELARRGGFMFIHLHGWWRTLGHYDINRGYYPGGLEEMKAVVAKIHAAGLRAGIHTLTACIDPRDSWVTPRPSPDLIASARYTLARPFGAKERTLYVNEKPVRGHELVWTYASNGNAIRIGDEIIRYSAISHEPPYAFMECERGAFGTVVAEHAAGATADYLQQRYIAFYPEPDSALADELADAIAKVYNSCGLDMLYFDGSEGMRSRYGIDTMRWKIFQRLQLGGVSEASCHGHNNWWFHSRLGAWDHPVWAMKQFHDDHIRIASRYRQTDLVEPQLGWWSPRGPSTMARGQFVDEMEYFVAKNLAMDGPMSIQSVNVSRRPPNGRQEDMFTILGWYERLRLARYFDAATLARVAEPGQDFRLRQDGDGQWRFTPVAMAARRLTALNAQGVAWTAANPHAAQPLRARIEALYSLAPVDDKQAAVLIDFSDDGASKQSCATGVKLAVEAVSEDTRGGARNLRLRATNARETSRGSWAMLGRSYGHPYHSMGAGQGVGLWVKGDGSGALLNVQLRTPAVYHGAISDHYVDLDFTGWRYVELPLRERDSARLTDYEWPYRASGGSHAVYRNYIRTSALSEINVFINEVPAGGTVDVVISPIFSLPLRKNSLSELSLAVNGRQLTLPWALGSGEYVEIKGPDGVAHYNERGEFQDRIKPEALPVLAAGDNAITLAAKGLDGLDTRAELTVIALGESFGAAAEKVDWAALDREYEMPRVVTAKDIADGGDKWTISSRAGATRPRLEIEIDVQAVGAARDAHDASSARLVDACSALAEYRPSERNDYAKFAFDSENQGTAKPGVTFTTTAAASPYSEDGALCFTATSTRQDNGGWAAVGRRFAQPLDFSGANALSFWLHGDGGNYTFKVQLRDVKGAWHDMVTRVDFTGWRLCSFPLDDLKLDPGAIAYILYYFNSLGGGRTASCLVDDVKAVSAEYYLDTPVLTLAGQDYAFPVRLAGGQRLRCRDGRHWQLLNARGKEMASGDLPAALPPLPPGESLLRLALKKTGGKDFKLLLRAVKIY
ncbi:MAG: CIA30 family protein [Lentisphaeria bacterium]|nr:CIA30 family protein [Lentisphaeria bacterium]